MIERKLYGCIAGAAVGEAMGAATATWTTDMIRAAHGGYLTALQKPPVSTKCKGRFAAGQPGDAFTYSWQLLGRFVADGEIHGEHAAAEELLTWGTDPDHLDSAGYVTRESYCALAGIDTGYRYPFLTFDHHKISNEAAARTAAVAVFYPGDCETACQKAIMVYKNIYNNMVSLSGAGAMAAAISEALRESATCHSVLAAAVHGARRGYDIADSYRAQPAACPLVSRRIELAIEIGLKYQHDFDRAIAEIEACVGNSSAANESVPAVFGCLAATGGSAAALTMAVNLGNDTDMMGAMAGALVGALDPEALSPADIQLVSAVGGYDFATMAANIARQIQG